MTNFRLALLGLVPWLGMVATGCSASSAGDGAYSIRGSIVDAETGLPVSRASIYVHAFVDAIDRQTSLEPADSTSFAVRMPAPDVRLRVADRSDEYHLYEERLTVPSDGLEHVVRLVPTHYVLLRGRLVKESGGSWVSAVPEDRSGIGGCPMLWFHREGAAPGAWGVDLDSDGSFEVRLPRERFDIFIINSSLQAESPSLDLSGVSAEVLEREIRLVP